MRIRNTIIWFILAALVMPLVLTGCGGGGSKDTLTVLAGSELKDVEPLFDKIRQETGVTLEMEYIGTLDGAEKLVAGEPYDLAWFSHGKYIALLKGGSIPQEKTMLSPVVLGIKQSKAREWGWVDNPDLTWQEIADKASSGELRYAMTNPASSNSGFTALVGVASALSGSSDALQVENINNAALQEFFKGQKLIAGSSGWLAEDYVEQQDRLDGIINYESVLLQLNESGHLRDKLYLIYPKEGIITADYPLMLINSDKREAYDRLVEYMRTPEFQEALMESTLRRPVIPQVKLSNKFPSQMLVELPFPNSADVIDALIFAYLNEQRIPAHAFFVLDVSGSMKGEGIRDLKTALQNLTGLDTSITGQFAQFRNREMITLVTFNDRVNDVRSFEITGQGTDTESMQQIRSYVDALDAGGGTAMYGALKYTYETAMQAQQSDPDRYYSIVLMSDGKNTDGIRESQFMQFYSSLPEDGQSIKTFTILFGKADEDAMDEIAHETAGRMFDAKSESLSFIFKKIRGYQ